MYVYINYWTANTAGFFHPENEEGRSVLNSIAASLVLAILTKLFQGPALVSG